MSEFGYKIKNFEAGSIYGVMLGMRDRYDYTEAMLTNSLFTDFLLANGLQVKKDCTKDIICLDFNYGTRGPEDEIKHLVKRAKEARLSYRVAKSFGNKEEIAKKIFTRKKIAELYMDVKNNPDKYQKVSKEEIRKEFYNNGVHITYKTKSGKEDKDEFFINRDEYVLRWDGTRWYFMKFKRSTEELLNLEDEPYNETNKRFYMGVTNPSNFEKIESPNHEYFAFCKQKEIYIYNSKEQKMTNIFSYRIKDEDTFEKIANDYAVKILDVDDAGDVTYIIYGYNMVGLNEGNMGIDIFTYHSETNESEEKLFIPIYTTFQSLKYDISRLCVYKNNSLTGYQFTIIISCFG